MIVPSTATGPTRSPWNIAANAAVTGSSSVTMTAELDGPAGSITGSGLSGLPCWDHR